jgi:LCP family protein required for cell wall assembly
MAAQRWPMVWVIVSLVMLALVGGAAFYRPFQSVQIPDPPPLSGVNISVMPPTALPKKLDTFLVMGVDKRGEDYGRSDSMVVLSYDAAKDQLAMLSIPRDTFVEIPGYGYDKINHSYAFGGPNLAVKTVQGMLGIEIDYHITIAFDAFDKLINAIGGIDIDAEKRMLYHDPDDLSMGPDGLVIDIYPGPQRMDGEIALSYARYRMDDEGDIGRMRRQQQVGRAILEAVAKPRIISRIPQLIPAVADTVMTNLTIGEMLMLGTGARDAIRQPLLSGTWGGMPNELHGVFYIVSDLVKERTAAYELLVGTPPDESFLKRAREDQQKYGKAVAQGIEETAAMVEHLDQEEPEETEPVAAQPSDANTEPVEPPAPTILKPITISIVDASGKNLGASYAQQLRSAGFRVARIVKARKKTSKTVAYDYSGQRGTDERLETVIPGIRVILSPDKNAPEAVQIVLGTDLK